MVKSVPEWYGIAEQSLLPLMWGELLRRPNLTPRSRAQRAEASGRFHRDWS